MPASFSETGSPDATFEYAGPVDSGPRQADVKTEVYQAGETPFYPESDQASSVNSEPVPDFYSTSVIDDVPEFTSQPADDGFAPDSTVPVISFESESSRSAATSPEFSTASGVAEDPYATRTPPRALPENQVGAAGVAVPAKKSSSKAVWFVGGLAVLFFFAAVAAGAGWFIYTNYYAVAVQPTPEPSPEPTPEPTVEALIESNTDMGSSDVSNTNTNTAPDVLIVEPTPMPEVETGEANVVTRPSPQIGTRKTPVRTGNTPPGAKPTPRKTPDRTVILQ
jgi:hypothetical protein